MSIVNNSVLEIFAKNRAEELPEDLWGQFVLPLDFKRVSLQEKTKAAVIVGGRGTGKTMFLKYHCHATVFSKQRTSIDKTSLKFIGIHWRPDTTFTQNIKEEWLGIYWESVFNSFISLAVLIEFSKLINNICNSNIDGDEFKNNLRQFEIPKPIQNALNINAKRLADCEEDFQEALFQLTNWIRFPTKESPPFNVDLKQTVLLMILKLKGAFKEFDSSIFHVFVDEFENLTTQQQIVINTWLKHGEFPLLFSIAYKKFANVSRDTQSQEKLEDRDDYRLIDVESLYFDSDNPKNFEVLASELLILKLFKYLDFPKYQEIISTYSDISSLSMRRNQQYQKYLREVVEKLFPGESNSHIANFIFEDKALLNKLVNSLIKDGLNSKKESVLVPNDFINKNFPEASIVNGVLLHRDKISPAELKSEFEQLIKNGINTKYQGWIQNNLVGVLLYLFNTQPNRVCPIYAGFSSFILMSKGNLRHFLELCFQSLAKFESLKNDMSSNAFLPIPTEVQSKATFVTSTNQFGKIVNSGTNGKHLQKIAFRLGIIFSLHQKRKSQSEPEVNHFSIDITDVSLLDVEVQKLLNESLVWSVLIPYKSTKNKSETDIEQTDYLLHPVLSCRFGISFRKKRKIKFSPIQLKTIFTESDEAFDLLYETFRKKLNVKESFDDEVTLAKNTQFSLL